MTRAKYLCKIVILANWKHEYSYIWGENISNHYKSIKPVLFFWWGMEWNSWAKDWPPVVVLSAQVPASISTVKCQSIKHCFSYIDINGNLLKCMERLIRVILPLKYSGHQYKSWVYCIYILMILQEPFLSSNLNICIRQPDGSYSGDSLESPKGLLD